MLGVVLVAMMAASATSALLFLLSAPLWQIVLAYPVTGTLVMLAGLVFRESRALQWLRGDKPTILARVTARFRAGQPPR